MNRIEKKNIVILGAGFAGITAVLKISEGLRRTNLLDRYTLVLVNEGPYHLFTPSLYEIASIPKKEAAATKLRSIVCIPIEDIIENRRILFLQERANIINRFSKTIYFLGNRALDYEYLVIATGSETATFNIPGVAEYGLTLKTFKDAIVLRNTVDAFVQTQKEVRIIVAGGGPTGVEFLAECHNYICYLQKESGNRLNCDVHLELIEAGNGILNGFSKKTVRTAEKRLRSLGVNIHTHARIVKLTSGQAHLEDGARINFDLFVWGGGVKGASILNTLNIPLTKKGNAVVNEYLRLPEDSSIFVIGDSASFTRPGGTNQLPWIVPIAESEGRRTAKNIINAIRKKPLLSYAPPKAIPYVITVGQKFAIANLGFIEFSGSIAWFIKQLIELRYLLFILPTRKAFGVWLRALRYFNSND